MITFFVCCSHAHNSLTLSEQPSITEEGDTLEGGQGTIDPINSCPSQTAPGDEIETSANHLYDDLINYTSQASHTDSECSHINHKTSISGTSVKVGTGDGKKTTKDEDDSEIHTYAVLEETVPPVPERSVSSLSLSLSLSLSHTHTHTS